MSTYQLVDAQRRKIQALYAELDKAEQEMTALCEQLDAESDDTTE